MPFIPNCINANRRSPLHAMVTVLLLCLSVFAQPPSSSALLGADEVMARVVARNEDRARALAAYTSVRSYHLECHCIVPKKADMEVRANYSSPNKKDFAIMSESGSGTVRDKVFRALLKAEEESMQDDNQQRSAVTPANYTFRLVKYEKTSNGDQYVIDAEPRTKNKFLFRGRLWVDGNDFAVTRVEGEPAVNPSWWTKKTDFTRVYEKVGGFWLPRSNESVTKVRVFGTAVLKIQYDNYKVTETPGVALAFSTAALTSAQ